MIILTPVLLFAYKKVSKTFSSCFHNTRMSPSSLVLMFLLVLIIEINAEIDDELSWTTSMGNVRNTRRLIPSIPTGYNGTTWTLFFNSSTQDKTVFGSAAGANGDLYLFITDSPYSSGIYI